MVHLPTINFIKISSLGQWENGFESSSFSYTTITHQSFSSQFFIILMKPKKYSQSHLNSQIIIIIFMSAYLCVIVWFLLSHKIIFSLLLFLLFSVIFDRKYFYLIKLKLIWYKKKSQVRKIIKVKLVKTCKF